MGRHSYETKCVISIVIAVVIGFTMLSGAVLYAAHQEHLDAIQPYQIP